jgi:hypothetical protein
VAVCAHERADAVRPLVRYRKSHQELDRVLFGDARRQLVPATRSRGADVGRTWGRCGWVLRQMWPGPEADTAGS